eukprot:5590617-Pleurochrysis_carterae.AAC.1
MRAEARFRDRDREDRLGIFKIHAAVESGGSAHARVSARACACVTLHALQARGLKLCVCTWQPLTLERLKASPKPL